MEPQIKRYVIWGVSSLVALASVLVFNPFVIVKTGQVGVVLNFGAFNGQIMEQGIHWRTPIIQQVVKMSIQTEKLEVKSEAYSKDLQVITVDSAVNYSLAPQSAGEIYKTLRLDYESKVISPRVEAAVKQTIANYTAEELPGHRLEVTTKIQEAIKTTIPVDFVGLVYTLEDETFSDAYETAIEQKQVAQQNAEKASNELKKAEIDAKSRIAQAQGEAEAIKIQAQAINSTGGTDYVKLQWVQAWKEGGSKVPNTIIGTGGNSFLFNLTP